MREALCILEINYRHTSFRFTALHRCYIFIQVESKTLQQQKDFDTCFNAVVAPNLQYLRGVPVHGEKGGCGRNERKEDEDVDSKSPRGDMTGRFKSHLESLTQNWLQGEGAEERTRSLFAVNILIVKILQVYIFCNLKMF